MLVILEINFFIRKKLVIVFRVLDYIKRGKYVVDNILFKGSIFFLK